MFPSINVGFNIVLEEKQQNVNFNKAATAMFDKAKQDKMISDRLTKDMQKEEDPQAVSILANESAQKSHETIEKAQKAFARAAGISSDKLSESKQRVDISHDIKAINQYIVKKTGVSILSNKDVGVINDMSDNDTRHFYINIRYPGKYNDENISISNENAIILNRIAHQAVEKVQQLKDHDNQYSIVNQVNEFLKKNTVR